MIIELRGVEFVNKGAELMLQAILQEIRREIPEVKFAMEVTGRAPLVKLRENNILIKSNIKRRGFNLEPIINVLPNDLLKSVGFVKESGVNVILDGSGFAFGDKWGAKKAGNRMADHIVKWKQQGKKVILLPQAFGPFTEPLLVEKIKLILEYADLVFARDRVSYQYMARIRSGSNLFQYPDFTNLIKGHVPAYFNRDACQIGIIPNQKMMETENPSDNKNYLGFLKTVVELFQDKQERPFFLIHESKMDFGIAKQINEMLEQPIEIIREEDPLAVKGIIGACKAVVTSRFHGLVSALSQSIPCLATGWSHKYEMLFEDYHYEEGMSSVNDSKDVLQGKICMLLEEEKREEIIQNLSKRADIQKSLTKQMWSQVYNTIR